MSMGRKNNEYPAYMGPDGDRGGFIVRNPITGKRKRFTRDEEEKARKVALQLAEFVENERLARSLDVGLPTIAGLVDRWLSDQMQFKPWDEGTRQSVGYKLARIRKELGARVVARTDRLFLSDWLESFCKKPDQFNEWRYVLVLLWKFAVAKKYVDICEPEKIEPRSTSKKLASNQKVRRQLDTEGFRAILEKAPPWLALAMEISLVTLQARKEICSMKHEHFRDGHLFVIRDKVSGDSDMAFIRIEITEELDVLRRRSLSLDNTLSPYLIHRKAERERRDWIQAKEHWTCIQPGYVSREFAKARDISGAYDDLDAPQRPTFHEIRGLGARLYRKQGMPEEAIQALMTHANRRTTLIYLERGATALADDDYHKVVAPMRLRDVLKQS